jgi:hypothetical protein
VWGQGAGPRLRICGRCLRGNEGGGRATVGARPYLVGVPTIKELVDLVSHHRLRRGCWTAKPNGQMLKAFRSRGWQASVSVWTPLSDGGPNRGMVPTQYAGTWS